MQSWKCHKSQTSLTTILYKIRNVESVLKSRDVFQAGTPQGYLTQFCDQFCLKSVEETIPLQ